MKKLVLLLFVAALSSCSTVNFTACRSDKPIQEIKSIIIPIAVGNEWVYHVTFPGSKYAPQTQTVEIGEITELMYYNTGEQYYIDAYSTIINDTKSFRYYLLCDEAVTVAEIGNETNKAIISSMTIYEKFSKGRVDPNNDQLIWAGIEQIKTVAGNFECYVLQKLSPVSNNDAANNPGKIYNDRKFVSAKFYYSLGVVFVKKVFFH
ncbi:MAG: hypothetical protein PF588_03950, partial [Candidatus Kapabacteria bacterium]|nr:hypothetical protein [Candidatus Kapabacteria bacterium]